MHRVRIWHLQQDYQQIERRWSGEVILSLKSTNVHLRRSYTTHDSCADSCVVAWSCEQIRQKMENFKREGIVLEEQRQEIMSGLEVSFYCSERLQWSSVYSDCGWIDIYGHQKYLCSLGRISDNGIISRNLTGQEFPLLFIIIRTCCCSWLYNASVNQAMTILLSGKKAVCDDRWLRTWWGQPPVKKLCDSVWSTYKDYACTRFFGRLTLNNFVDSPHKPPAIKGCRHLLRNCWSTASSRFEERRRLLKNV